MPDAEGYLLPGELGGGGYGAIEGDLGEKLRPLAGFGRDLAEPAEQEVWDGVVFTPECASQTVSGAVVFQFPSWNPL